VLIAAGGWFMARYVRGVEGKVMRYTLTFTVVVVLLVWLSGCGIFHHVSCLPRSIAVACANSGAGSSECAAQRQWIVAHPEYVGDER
jgi:hypothetical protein